MPEVVKDCGIKLFGKTITLLPYRLCNNSTSTSQDSKDVSGGELTHESESESMNPALSESSDAAPSLESSPKTDPNKEEASESSVSQEKTLKKPDKIIPCPRCDSMDTKFCYYNNYNVNQPRYFCRNCQRYWTSGGTMRNVPVGSGRRKNKNADYRVSDDGIHSNGFLIFGSDGPVCDQSINFVDCATNEPSNSTACAPSGFPVTFYPYWGCSAIPSPWNMPWSTSPISSTLGKHSREEKTTSAQRPKTLRIDDPNEAAKSSMWSTLGIKKEINGGCLFEPKGHSHNTTMALQANPAALSRSLNFHESA